MCDNAIITTTYEYSSQGRLLKVVTPTNTIEYRHNALGNRVVKLVDGDVVEKYLWENKTRLLAVYDGSGNLKQRYEYALGNTPASYTEGSNRYYILTDQLGSPRMVTDEDGTLLREIEYDSFGNIVADSAPEIKLAFSFAGGLYDTDTGLIRFGYRDYDPETGRWTARDPIGFDGGDTNLYGYVLGDPVNGIDPEGLWVIVLPLVGGISLEGYAVGGAGILAGTALGDWLSDLMYSEDGESDGDRFGGGESCPGNDKDNWEKIPGSDQAYRPKGGKEPVFEKDRGGDRSHGGSDWKKWDKYRDWSKGKPRNGTYNDNGQRLRD